MKVKKIVINWYKQGLKEIKAHPFVYLSLAIILILALFVRVYRLDQLLQFYFDQGRDALVIWEFWHEGNLFLIGPTTGIEGIFRGPWYYWLIAPFYLLAGGDPVWPATFLALTTVVAIAVLYYLAVQTSGRTAGFLAIIIASFSFFFVLAARWLSNPTPMLLISMLLILFLFAVLEGKRWAWVVIGFLLGMSMQFGSAAEIFYFPAVGIFALWQRKNLPNKRVALLAIAAFVISFIPQILFDLIHGGIILSSIKTFLFEKESFRTSFQEVVFDRIQFYYQVFFSKLAPTNGRLWGPFLTLFAVSLLFNAKYLFTNKRFLTTILVFVAPLFGMLFFQGNVGYIFDYYFTGYYFVFVLIFSTALAAFARKFVGFVIVFAFIAFFLGDNLVILESYMSGVVDSPNHISLGSENPAVDWVIEDSKERGEEFNVDVYVPPVIPHAYDYLFLWRTTQECGVDLCNMQLDRRVPLLYTLYEVDPPHPERLEAWLERQKGIGVVEDTVIFGGVTVERRTRIEQ